MNHIPKIIIKPVMPENQRYATIGDFWYDAEDDTLIVFVSRMDDWRSELAVALHEVFEATKCLADEIDFTDIDLFDFQYEKSRKESDLSEPGDSKDAPYHEAHIGATWVEKEVCTRLDLPWEVHERNVNGV